MIFGENMRTLSEINRDIQQCEAIISKHSNKDCLHYKALLYDLKEEKEEIWNTLFNGYKNQVI